LLIRLPSFKSFERSTKKNCGGMEREDQSNANELAFVSETTRQMDPVKSLLKSIK
jgi:hypothetical protein